MRCFLLTGALVAVVGCAGDLPGQDDAPDASVDPTGDSGTPVTADAADPGGPDAAPACVPIPAPHAAWMTPYQQDLVARLTGAAEIAPGVTLIDRASAGRRGATRTFLQAKFTELGLAPELHSYAEGASVFARLPATTPTAATVVIGAHFDSVSGSPGADDNASGVALVFGVARWLKDIDCRQVNVIFVLFDQEEVGLLGSTFFAEFLAGSGMDVLAVHSIDQVGWDADGDRGIELERAASGLAGRYVAAVDAAGLGIPIAETNTGGTDHAAFPPYGIASIGVTEQYASGDTTPYYHTSSDTYGTVDFDFLESTTALVSVVFSAYIRP